MSASQSNSATAAPALKVPALCVGAAALGALGAGFLLARRQQATREKKWTPPEVWVEDEIRTTHGLNRATAGTQQEKDLPVGSHSIQLHSLGTPNGVKATIMLEEIIESGAYPDFDYDAFLRPINGPQFDSGFVAINPNSKIPAMVDTSDPANSVRVFESGAIIMYLAEKFPHANLVPQDSKLKAECLSWVFWSIGAAPFTGGGFGHFYNYAPQNKTAGFLEYPINRYAQEVKRQLSVLDNLFADGRKYVCGDEYSIADIAIWPWFGALVLGRLYNAEKFLSVHEYTHLRRWAADLEESRPAVRRGRLVNRPWGLDRDTNPLYDGLPCLAERHSKSDWETASK